MNDEKVRLEFDALGGDRANDVRVDRDDRRIHYLHARFWIAGSEHHLEDSWETDRRLRKTHRG
jgi:hypothetical protein